VSRRILILSAVMVILGLAALIYVDPLARLSFGATAGRVFTANSTRTFTGGTFTFGNRTISVTPGSGVPGAFAARGVDSTGMIETLVAVALVAVGIVLEVLVIFLWQGKPTPPSTPGYGTTQT
jgi:hypothetical protein